MRTTTAALTAAAAALTLAVGTMTTAAGASAAGPRPVRAGECRTLAGHSFTVGTDVGFVERYDYSRDGKQLTATVVQPGSFGLPVGTVTTVPIQVAPIGPETYLVSWVEAGGFTVSEAQNLRTGAVNLFWTFPDGAGSQIGEEHTGTIACV